MRGIHKIPTTIITPQMAVELLEKNKQNRPLSDPHVKRIAREIELGRWQYNGDTIKIADNDDVLDGQHRLWAVIEAKTPIETIIVNGIKVEAFTTIDTIRKPRSGSDVVALAGHKRNRHAIAQSLMWLIRWERGHLAQRRFRGNEFRVENQDVKDAFDKHPNIVSAVDKTTSVRRIATHSILACFYYVLCCHSQQELADRLVETLEDPVNVSQGDPFFRFRAYCLADHLKRKDHVTTFALLIKAANAAHAKRRLESLTWRSQGKSPEEFPVLKLK